MSALQTILLIDDDDTTNFLHRRLLLRLNIAKNVVIAGNGDEALKYLQKINTTKEDLNLPDLIFLDIKMPVMDGFEFLAEFEKLDLTKNSPIPVFMLTTSVNPSDIAKLDKYPAVNKYLTKPLTEEKINQVLKSLSGK